MWVALLLASLIVVPPVLANVCVTYRTITIPNPNAVGTQTIFEGINRAGRILGRHADNSLPWFILQREATSDKFTLTTVPVGTQQRSEPRGLNRYGEVVGLLHHVATGKITGFVRKTTGQIKVIGVPDTDQSYVMGLNQQGDMVGQYLDMNEGEFYGFFRTSVDGQETFTPIIVPGAPITMAAALNDLRTVVGWYRGDDDQLRGFARAPDGTLTLLDVPGALGTYFMDVNNTNSMVGGSINATEEPHGILYEGGLWYAVRPNVGEISSIVTGINHFGEMVGTFRDSAGSHGFIATRTTCPLGTPLTVIPAP